MGTQWSAPKITYSVPPPAPPISPLTLLAWLVLGVVSWLPLILTAFHIWTVV